LCTATTYQFSSYLLVDVQAERRLEWLQRLADPKQSPFTSAQDLQQAHDQYQQQCMYAAVLQQHLGQTKAAADAT
jgi:hypothetical protein